MTTLHAGCTANWVNAPTNVSTWSSFAPFGNDVTSSRKSGTHDAPDGSSTLPASTCPVTAFALDTLSESTLTGMMGSRVVVRSDWIKLCPLAASSMKMRAG